MKNEISKFSYGWNLTKKIGHIRFYFVNQDIPPFLYFARDISEFRMLIDTLNNSDKLYLTTHIDENRHKNVLLVSALEDLKELDNKANG